MMARVPMMMDTRRASDEAIDRAFRSNLLWLLEERELSQAGLSRACDIHVNTIRYYTRGGHPSLVPLVRMADALGVSIDELVGHIPHRHMPE